jgi:Ca-activated chloride channel family protein
VDQERPNLFTTTVANVAPREELTIEIAWLEALPWRDGRYSLRLPLAVTPRYTPGLALDAASPQAAETARLATVLTGLTPTPERVANTGQSVAIEVRLRPGFPLGRLESPHHAIEVVEDGDDSLVRLAGSRQPADRDFELTWMPDALPQATLAVFTEARGADHFALLLVTPPAFTQGGARPRELTFVIDTSGSMEGPSLEQACAALAAGIRRLGPGERFNVIRFSDEARALFPAPGPADEIHRATALAFVDSLRASGGTNIRAAVELALALPGDAGRLRQVVFATDGSVANEAELVALVKARAGHTRWFTIGIGAAPNPGRGSP